MTATTRAPLGPGPTPPTDVPISNVPVPVAAVPPATSPTIPLMKPRYKLLGFFAFILALWIAMMAFMYAATVYPQRHPPAPSPKASVPSPDAAPSPNNPAR